MTISLPVPLAFQSSTVTDDTPTLLELAAGCNKPVIGHGLEVQADSWIYSYAHADDLVIPEWNQTDVQKAAYKIGDVVWKDCKLQIVTAQSGERWVGLPLEVEEQGYDTNFDPTQWSNRYWRTKAFSKNQWCANKFSYLNKLYYLQWNACDRNCLSWQWVVKCTLPKTVGCYEYKKSCLKENNSTKFEAGKDVKAEYIDWRCTPTVAEEKIIIFNSMIERGGYFYFRTHLDIAVKRTPMPVGAGMHYTTRPIVSPEEIDGFKKRRKAKPYAPFDGKNYTRTTVNTGDAGFASWTMLANGKFDAVALGHIIADKVNIKFADTNGNETGAITNYLIDNTTGYDTSIEHFSTIVLYTDGMMPEETVVTIEIWGGSIEIGELMIGETVDTGFTNLAFKNQYKDLSPKFTDQWGNIEYKDGVKVNVHSGTVDVPMVGYDQLNRLMLKLGARKLMINSSDSRQNQSPDGHTVFQATMMIGRFTSFAMTSRVKNKRMMDLGQYTFSIEEQV